MNEREFEFPPDPDGECRACYSTSIYRADRCQVHYRYFLKHGKDVKLTIAQLRQSLEREQAKRLRQSA